MPSPADRSMLLRPAPCPAIRRTPVPRPPSTRHRSALIPVITVLLAGACGGDGGRGEDNGSRLIAGWSIDGEPTATEIAQLNDFLDADVPTALLAGPVRARLFTGGLDDILLLRVPVATADVDSFLVAIGTDPDEPLVEGARTIFTSEDSLGWFRTDELTEFRGASGRTSPGLAYHVMVDGSDPEVSVLYLEIFET